MDYSSPKEAHAREARLDQLADLVCALAARVSELERKVAALKSQNPPHLQQVERRTWTPTINGHVAPVNGGNGNAETSSR